MPTVNVDQLILLVEKLPLYSVKRIVLTGGEPTLVGRLSALIKIAKSVGLEIVLSTNGLLLYKQLSVIAPYLDWIGLPLDADNLLTNQLMRPGDPGQFTATLGMIKIIKAEYPQVGVKLRTVVCRLNQDAIVGIPSLIGRELVPDVWKLYQVVYEGYGLRNRLDLEMDDGDFERIINKASLAATEYRLHVKFYRRSERSGRYLFLYPNGDAAVVANEETLILGNAFSDLDAIATSWQNHIIPERMNSHLLHL